VTLKYYEEIFLYFKLHHKKILGWFNLYFGLLELQFLLDLVLQLCVVSHKIYWIFMPSVERFI